ncbi:MAG: hypothetical protein WCB01_15220 [Candidatus Cybelea sp.]
MLWWLAGFAVSIGALVLIGPYVNSVVDFFQMLATVRPLNWDVVEAKGSDCQLRDHPAFNNNHGMVAVREANCPGYFAQGTAYNVVFVHSTGEANDRDNLAFQYTPGFEGNTPSPLPTVIWKSATLLEITAPGVIEDIKVQKTDVSGIRLSYSLGRRLSILDFP